MKKKYNVYPEGFIDFIYENYGKLTCNEIADKLGVKRERVRGLITRHKIKHKNKQQRLLSPEDRSYSKKYASYKHDAISRGFEFRLTMEQFKELTSENCFYCGSHPKPFKGFSKKGHSPAGIIMFNGIDRISSKNGYNKNNCVTCCSICNEMKMDRSVSNFIDQVERIYEFFVKEKIADPIRKKS